MDLPSRLGFLALEVKEYMRNNVEPQLSLDERLLYLENYSPQIKFSLTTLSPRKHILVKTPKIDTATELDAIVTQAIFGREYMMKRDWFRAMHNLYGRRLITLPHRMPPELRKMRSEFILRDSARSLHATTSNDSRTDTPILTPETSSSPATNSPISNMSTASADDLLALLKRHTDEMTSLESKHDAELEEHFDNAAQYCPGLRGVLCGVQHSFRDKRDQCAEKKALISATMEYIAQNVSGRGL